MREDQLSMRLTGREEHIPASSFAVCFEQMFQILRDMDTAISEGNRPSLKWSISKVAMNSPLVLSVFGASTEDIDVGREVITAYSEGLRRLEEGTERVPQHFTIKTLEAAKKLVSVLSDGIQGVEFFTPYGDLVKLTLQTAVTADKLMGKFYEEYATFEGTLEVLSVHGGYSFNLYDDVHGRIPCTFKPELLDTVREMFSGRVLVAGQARYSPSRRVVSLRVEHIRRLRSQNELPQFSDLESINLTGGVDSTEFVRSLRSAD